MPVITSEGRLFGLENLITDAIIGENHFDQFSVVYRRTTASPVTGGVDLNQSPLTASLSL